MSDAQNKVGTYELKNCIASGKTTQIWEVTENGTLSFAMKLMLEDARKKPEEKAILKHEFKVGKSFDHPSVIRFHKIEVSRDHAFFIMDFFRAPSMKVQIATNLPDVQSRFARIAESICTAMTHGKTSASGNKWRAWPKSARNSTHTSSANIRRSFSA